MSTTLHFGLAIDPITNDLFLAQDNSLAVVEGAKAIGQHVRQRLMTFQKEWFLDEDAGVPWIEDILGKGYNPALAEAVVKANILETPGVVEITSFSVSFDSSTRGLIIKDVTVLTVYDTEVRI